MVKNPRPETPLFVGDEQLRALTELADIFATSVYPKLIPSSIASPGIGNSTPIVIPKQPRVTTQGNHSEKPRVPESSIENINNPKHKYNLRSANANHIASVCDFDLTVAANLINSALSFKCDSHFLTFPVNNPYDYEFNTTSPLINAIFHPDTGEIMTYRKLIKDENTRDIWLRLFANKLG